MAGKTIRARFDGKVFVPEETVDLAVGDVVTLQTWDQAEAIRDYLENGPKLHVPADFVFNREDVY